MSVVATPARKKKKQQKRITIKEAADRLGVHENTVRNWIDRQILRSYRLPSGQRRLVDDEVERLETQMFGVPTSFPDVEVTKAPRAHAPEPVTGNLP